ncbi:MAG: CDP-glucose 4,6-dehydratase [bacterium]
MFANAFRNRTVWLSGHTGFKGAWLAEWLLAQGATVHGYALPPATEPSLFEQLGLASRLEHENNDVRDREAVRRSIQRTNPDFVFHLAAQPLVRQSYAEPVETYATNVLGTIHVLDALRALRNPCAAVFVTTDKCYENREWIYGYRENDPLGGHDPYSSSKAAAEIAIASFRRSFFREHPVRIASARAGNVIGGGDWAVDRIFPDAMRALQLGQPIPVRNPHATRPWQHVLEPLSGYLWLAACLSQPSSVPPSSVLRPLPSDLATAFNFGPTHESNRTVAQLVTEIIRHWEGGRWEDKSDPAAVHEAGLLQLSIDRAHALLGWSPIWKFPEAVSRSVAWYRETKEKRTLTQEQITRYCADARQAGVPWAQPV